MKPVDQTRFGGPPEVTGQSVGGNCFQACVASILEIDIDDVPDFCNDYGSDAWWPAFVEWCSARGLDVVYERIGQEIIAWPDDYFIMGGMSHSGPWMHAVVARGAEIVHDPNPKRRGLFTKEDAITIRARVPA